MDDLPEDNKMEESENCDRLSELPLALILHILSFLSMRDVISTTLLSKNWNDLWTTIPYLDFGDFSNYDPLRSRRESFEKLERFLNFVNQSLIVWKGTKILKFTIRFYSYVDESIFSDIDSWVCHAVENKVEELSIHLKYEPDAIIYTEDVVKSSKEVAYWMPTCLNSCLSIKKLSLDGCNLQTLEPPKWNQLKSLTLNGYCFGEDLVNQIMFGSPQLEDFTLDLLESHENLNIRSSSLKKLAVRKFVFKSDDRPTTATVLRIWCPNLEKLKLSGFFYRKCLLTNVSSLTDVDLELYSSFYLDEDEWTESLGDTLRQMFPTIGHVEKVELSECCIQALGAMQKKYQFSPLSEVKLLKLDVCFVELDETVSLLSLFPKLKMLVIEHRGYAPEGVTYETYLENQLDALNHMESKTELPVSFMLQLKTVEITSPLLDTSIFPLIEFLFKHAGMLEKMVIRADRLWFVPPREYLLLVAKKLLCMPKANPTAKLYMSRK